MTKINSPAEVPEMLATLWRQDFYGDIHITFRGGEITRIVTESSQVFNSSEGRPQHNDNRC